MKSSSFLKFCSRVLILFLRFGFIVYSVLANSLRKKWRTCLSRISKVPILSDLNRKTFLEGLIYNFNMNFWTKSVLYSTVIEFPSTWSKNKSIIVNKRAENGKWLHNRFVRISRAFLFVCLFFFQLILVNYNISTHVIRTPIIPKII